MACKELQLCNIKYSVVSLMPKGERMTSEPLFILISNYLIVCRESVFAILLHHYTTFCSKRFERVLNYEIYRGVSVYFYISIPFYHRSSLTQKKKIVVAVIVFVRINPKYSKAVHIIIMYTVLVVL